MRNHWWERPGWRPGRRTYSWFLTFEDQPQLDRLVEQYRQRLRGVEGLDRRTSGSGRRSRRRVGRHSSR